MADDFSVLGADTKQLVVGDTGVGAVLESVGVASIRYQRTLTVHLDHSGRGWCSAQAESLMGERLLGTGPERL